MASVINIPKVAVVAQEKFRIIQLPAKMSTDERMAVVASALSTLSRRAINQMAAVELVYNLFYMAIPSMQGTFSNATSVTTVLVNPPKEVVLHWVGLDTAPDSYDRSLLPALPGPPAAEAAGVTSEVAVHVALSAILHAVGKQASETARESVLDRRPDALIRRFDVAETDQLLFPGRSAGPTREVLEQVYQAFANYSEVRTALMGFFLGLQRAGSHLPLPLEILMTNFQLLRGAGMTHVGVMVKLAHMHPWTLHVPQLEPYWAKFHHDLQIFEKFPQDIRHYHRLLVAQKDYLFISADLRPLSAVANAIVKEVEKTFGAYEANEAAYQELIDEVKSRAPNYIPGASTNHLAALLGVPDVALPSKSSHPAITASATV